MQAPDNGAGGASAVQAPVWVETIDDNYMNYMPYCMLSKMLMCKALILRLARLALRWHKSKQGSLLTWSPIHLDEIRPFGLY
jgi:hypothetical protein